MKNALITGASRGIGRAIAIKLAQMNYNVLINYVSNETEANKTLDIIKSNDNNAELLKFDVANLQETEAALDNWHDNNPNEYIETLINNAGTRNDTLLMWMKTEEWHNVINVSLNGFFNITRYLIKNMLIKKYGRIINIVSLSGIKGMPGQVNYSAAKAAIIGATKALAQEVGKKNVTVNAVAPGFIKTDMIKDLNEKDYKQFIPLQRFGEPEEVAEMVAFLASDKASYITGEVISINGGIYM